MSDHARSRNGDAIGPDSENVVLLSIDSLRADHCGFMGYESDVTPTLDSLAANGVVYDTAIAPGPRTPSSMPVAWTGRFNLPSEFAYGDWQHRYGRISAHIRRHETISERLQAAGYTTVGVTVNPWTQKTDFDTGFDRFVEITGEDVTAGGYRTAPVLTAIDSLLSRVPLGERYQWHTAKDWFVQWPHFYDRIVAELADVSGPYFLWVFLLDPHQPYLAPGRYRTDSNVLDMYYANYRERSGERTANRLPSHVERRLHAAYTDAIRSVDGFVDRLRDDLAGDPTMIVHSDHGDAFNEHGTYGHESELYEENLHVPLLVYDGEHEGRVSGPVSLRSLPDLVASLTTREGYDPASFTREFVMAGTEGHEKLALRGRRWKYIAGPSVTELYDLQADPGETVDLSDDRPDLAAALGDLLAACERPVTEEATITEAALAFDERAGVVSP